MALYVTLLWHFASAFLAFSTLAFGLAALGWPRWWDVSLGLAVLTVGMGVMFLVLGLIRLGTPFATPQWVLLIPIGLMALWPLRTQTKLPIARG
ncbi:MAG: hypothetical protein AB3N23_00260 [Paracoccaceae bacterium]